MNKRQDSHTLVQQQAKACADCAPSLAGGSELLRWMDKPEYQEKSASESQEKDFCEQIAGIFASIKNEAEYVAHIAPQKDNPKEDDLSELVKNFKEQQLVDLQKKELDDEMKHDADIRSLFMFADQQSEDAKNFFALRRLMLDRAGVNLKNVADIDAAELSTIQKMAFQSILIEAGKYEAFSKFDGLKSSHFIELVIMDFYLPYFNAIYSQNDLDYGNQAAKLFLSLAIKDLLQTLDKALPEQ
jgi:hypothetical protein